MALIHTADEENHILLTEGYAPPSETLYAACPQPLRRRQAIDHLNPDDALAWIVTAYTQRLLSYALPYGRLGTVRDVIPIETWVIGPPNEDGAELSAWFDGELRNTNYRLFLQREPRICQGQELVLNVLSKTLNKLGVRHRTGKYAELKRSTEPLLESLTGAYREGHEAVESRMKRTKHSYAFSAGLPNR